VLNTSLINQPILSLLICQQLLSGIMFYIKKTDDLPLRKPDHDNDSDKNEE